MCCSSNNGNNLHLNMYAKVGKPERKLIWVNTIDYDAKIFQAMKTMLNFIDKRLKRFKILTAHRIDVDKFNEYVTQLQYFK